MVKLFRLGITIIIILGVSISGCKNNKLSSNEVKIKYIKTLVEYPSLDYENSKNLSYRITSVKANANSDNFIYLETIRNGMPDKNYPYAGMLVKNTIHFYKNNQPLSLDKQSVLDDVDWLDDGKKIAYVVSDKKFRNHLVVYDIETEEKQTLYSTEPEDLIRDFAFIPRKHQILLLITYGKDVNNMPKRIVIYDTQKKRITKTLIDNPLLRNNFEINPEGKGIYYSVISKDGNESFYTLFFKDFDNDPRALFKDKEKFSAISVSPNGKWLAFTNDNNKLNLLNIDTKKRYVFKNVDVDFSISWMSDDNLLVASPDGIDKITLQFSDNV